MTRTQQARLVGFNTSLLMRGVNLSCGGVSFQAVRGFAPQSLDQFELGPAQRIDGSLYVLRDTFTALPAIAEQSIITETDTLRQWRVVRIEDNPINIAVILHCNLE